MQEDVPLVIPEVNAEDTYRHRGLIANPNCSTIIMNLAVWPLRRLGGFRRITCSTYQAASGAGAAAMEELRRQAADILVGRPPSCDILPHPIAFNLFCHESAVGPDGENLEERKMREETRRIFHLPDLSVATTCVRVPVFRAHSESIAVTFDRQVSPADARAILADAPGVMLVDDPERSHFPMPLEATGRDEVLVGRIRQDASRTDGCGLQLFVSGDQLRKGAALNAIQILELVAGRR